MSPDGWLIAGRGEDDGNIEISRLAVGVLLCSSSHFYQEVFWQLAYGLKKSGSPVRGFKTHMYRSTCHFYPFAMVNRSGRFEQAVRRFASGRCSEAAATIHGVLAVSQGWDWDTISRFYPDPL